MDFWYCGSQITLSESSLKQEKEIYVTTQCDCLQNRESDRAPRNERAKAVILTIYRTLYVHKDSVTAPYRCLKQPPNIQSKISKIATIWRSFAQAKYPCLFVGCAAHIYIGCMNPSCHDTAAKSFRHFARFLGLQEVSMRAAGKNAPCLVLQAPLAYLVLRAHSQHLLSAVDRRLTMLVSG
jgi:hypothetical protein